MDNKPRPEPRSRAPKAHVKALSQASLNIPTVRNRSTSPSPAKARSSSISIPLTQKAYKDYSSSPAASFLSRFAIDDDWQKHMPLKEGDALRDYVIGPLISRGTFSECRKAYSSLHHQDVAAKVINSCKSEGNTELKHHLAFWRQLDHPNILKLLEVVEVNSQLVAITLLADKSLLQRVNENPLSESQARYYFKQLLAAVTYLHNKGFAHGDIKLENILLSDDKLLLADFDMCHALTDCQSKGSLLYLPPEVLSGADGTMNAEANPESACCLEGKKDIWAMGVVLYAMIIGKMPFCLHQHSFSSHSIISEIKAQSHFTDFSPELSDLLSKMLKPNPQERTSLSEISNHHWFTSSN